MHTHPFKLSQRKRLHDEAELADESRFFRPTQYLIPQQLNAQIDEHTPFFDEEHFSASTPSMLTRTHDEFEGTTCMSQQSAEPPQRGRPKKKRPKKDLSELIGELHRTYVEQLRATLSKRKGKHSLRHDVMLKFLAR